MQVDLVRDVLDKRVLDANREIIGRVDTIRLELHDDGQLLVKDLCVGGPMVANRIGSVATRVTRWLRARIGPADRHTTHIAWGDVEHLGRDAKVRLLADDTPARQWEHWLDRKIVRRIPGGRTK
jgi:hypothetical protein